MLKSLISTDKLMLKSKLKKCTNIIKSIINERNQNND